ncbi:MAG: NUDIX hydrolase [Anaerolineae bacterium]
MLVIDTVEQLRAWLAAQGIDLRRWGAGHAKSVEDLWLELTEGESTLQDDPPMRMTRLVSVLIRQEDRTLVEARQTLRDERERPRSLPPSEKLKRDEPPLDAARRCLREELGIRAAEVQLVETELTRLPQDSTSYPGLATRYIVYWVEAHVGGLPETDFSTPETSPTGDQVRDHHWIWVKDYPYALRFEGMAPD